jgi:hypothetical protein
VIFLKNITGKIVTLCVVIVVLLSSVLVILIENNITGSVVPGASDPMPSLSEIRGQLLSTREQINPYNSYRSEPAPIGIADYGLGNNGNPYNYSTSSFVGNVTVNSISFYNSSMSSYNMTFQLNLNFVFKYNSISYDYWVQNVAYLNTFNMQITFIDNIWNLSSSRANMANSTVTGNGTVTNFNSTAFYYDFSNSSLAGNNITLSKNASFLLKMNAILGPTGAPEVVFLYDDGYGWVAYDRAIFHFANNLKQSPYFFVSGNSYNPANTYYDAELVMGGPGNGSSSNDINSSVLLMLEYYNGNNYQTIQNAYNFGGDTGETVYNALSRGIYGSLSGRLGAHVTNSTGSNPIGQIYNSSEVSDLKVISNISEGALYVSRLGSTGKVGNFVNVTNFVGGSFNVTLYNGTYSVKILDYSTGKFQSLGDITLIKGKETTFFSNIYQVIFLEKGLPSGSSWYLNLSGTTPLLINGNKETLYLQNGTYNYTLSATNRDYFPVNGTGTVFVNGTSQNMDVQFSLVHFNVTFTEVGLPPGSSWTVTLNGRGPAATSGSSIIFSVGNGTYDYVVQRAGSYVPSQSTGAVTVNGKSETVTVSFAILDGYLVGSIKPSEATLVINGTSYFITNGSFNISLKPGNYSVVLSAAGYVTYTANVTITPLNVTHLQTNGLVKESKTGFIIEVIIFLLLMTGAIGSMILSRRRR